MLQVIYYSLATAVLLNEIFRLVRKFNRDRHSISWEVVSEWVDQLYLRFQSEIPDVVIGLGRGGAVVAGLISAKYRDDPRFKDRVVPIATLDRLYLKNGETVIVGLHNLDVYKKRVLLLNADSYSGNTLNLARKLLEYGQPLLPVRRGTLVVLDVLPNEDQPDYIGGTRPAAHKNRALPWGRKQPQNRIDRLPGPRIVVVLNGLVATGKTSVADALFKELRYTAIYSDWYWFKQGLQDRERNLDTNVRHYKQMFSLCLSAAGSGEGVVLDTTSSLREIRDYMQNNSPRYGIRVVFVRCACSEESALGRIRGRKHIGPYDFGTEPEYRRIERLYEAIDQGELNARNLIDVDTDSLKCTCTHVLAGPDQEEVDAEVQKILAAIERHYLAQVRQSTRPLPSG